VAVWSRSGTHSVAVRPNPATRSGSPTAGAPLATGTGACPGVTTGVVCLSSERVDVMASYASATMMMYGSIG